MKFKARSILLLSFAAGAALIAFQNCSGGSDSGGATVVAKVESGCGAVFFTSQHAVELSTAVDSYTVTLADCTSPSAISVTGDGSPELYKNGLLVSGSETVTTGDTLRVRLTSSANENSTYQATVSVGIQNAVFSVATGDFTPAAFSFAPATGQSLSAIVTSAQATLSGFEGILTATVSGTGTPVILVNGNVVGTSAPVQAGNAISVRLTASGTENTTRQATVTIQGVGAIFDVTTTGDATVPSITSLTAPSNGSYKQATNLDFTANFTESVIANGSPRIIINIGGVAKYATYLSGSGTPTLIFRYSVQAATNDSDGILVGGAQLNGGSVNDSAGNSADLAFLPLNTAAVLIDTLAPSVQSATAPANGTFTAGQNLNFALTFNELVNVSGIPRLTLTVGATTRFAGYISGTGTNTIQFRYTVQSGDSDPNGIAVDSNLDFNGGNIADVATNAASLIFSAPNAAGVVVTDLPTAPQNLIATPAAATVIDLSWTDLAVDEAGFKIEKSADGINFSEIASVSANVTTYKSQQLFVASIYYYRVRASNVAGYSGYSNVANATTLQYMWTQISSATPPSVRMGHTTIFDSANQRMILFGGFGPTMKNDVWALSLGANPTWTAITPVGTPPAVRYTHTAIYDSANNRMIVFGGNAGGDQNDVWALSLSGTPTWTQILPSGLSAPAARRESGAVYDSVNQRMIIFGGAGGFSNFNDVWALNLSGPPVWTEILPTGTLPPGSQAFRLAFDSVHQKMYVFTPNSYYTWQLKLSGTPEWTELATPANPPVRVYSSLVTDSVNNRLIVFGGVSGYGLYNDVWAMNLSGTPNWVQLSIPGTQPTARFWHGAVFDPTNQRMIIFGGGHNQSGSYVYFNDTWQLGL
ncbi:MAG: kelch repeat-containing protein [Pseudomonadota bacterium]|nr:kelch repeat-containing protein [Pseudomonadota bacterium]